jgi:hypothetical protein
MKTRMSFLILVLLLLPLVLAACGGDKVGNAEKFLEAAGDNDFDEAKKYVCDDEKDNIEGEAAFPEGVELKDIECEEDGDDVKCSFNMAMEGVDGDTPVTMVFVMEGDKVCDVKAE